MRPPSILSVIPTIHPTGYHESRRGRSPASSISDVMPSSTPPTNLKVFAFDAYGTLFDVFSVTALCEALFPGNGHALAQLWRAKQLQYSLLRSLMDRFED